MPTKIQDMTSWGTLGDPSTRPSSLSSLSSPASQHDTRPSGLPGASSPWMPSLFDIGKRVGDRRWELSVVCDAAEAMRVQFEIVKRQHVAIHDIGGQASRRFLAGVAAAMQRDVHTLAIRRQGFGDVLATLQFVDLATTDSDGQRSNVLRLYSTVAHELDAAGARALSMVLLGRSRLAVVMVAADALPQNMTTGLANLKEGVSHPGWTNKSLLLLPLREFKGLTSMAAHLSQRDSLDVRCAPLVTRPVEAWMHLRSTWNAVASAAAEAGEIRMMLLADPTRSSDAASAGRAVVQASAVAASVPSDASSAPYVSGHAAVQLAERVASGRASPDELRRHLESSTRARPDTTRGMPLSPVAAPSRTVGTGRPATVETVERAPVWSRSEPLPQVATRTDAASTWPALHDDAATHAPALRSERSEPVPTLAHAAPTGPASGVEPSSVAVAVAVAVAQLLDQSARIKGMQCCGVIDVEQGRIVAHRAMEAHASAGVEGARLLAALHRAAAAFGLPGRLGDAALTFEQQHLVVCAFPHDKRLAWVGVLDKAEANAAMVLIKLQRLVAALAPSDEPKPYGLR